MFIKYKILESIVKVESQMYPYTSYAIEERPMQEATPAELCAVFQRDRRDFPLTLGVPSISVLEDHFNEAGLADLIFRRQDRSLDTGIMRLALDDLRARNAELAPKP
jgi:hypothetical protein